MRGSYRSLPPTDLVAAEAETVSWRSKFILGLTPSIGGGWRRAEPSLHSSQIPMQFTQRWA